MFTEQMYGYFWSMQVNIYPTRIEIFDSGFVLVLRGIDIRGAKRDESAELNPTMGRAPRRVLLELAYRTEPFVIDLGSVENQPRWTNNDAGVANCLADLRPIIMVSTVSSSTPGAKGSIEYNLGALQLVGDEDAPGPDKAYITDSSGNKVWGAFPAAGIGDLENAGSAPDVQLIESTLPTAPGDNVQLKRIKRDGLGIRAIANTGNVQINQHFSAADRFHYSDGFGDPLEAAITTLGRNLLDDSSQGAMQATLGLVPGTDIASLVGGIIPTSQIPAVAITEFLGDVASQSAMLALTGQRGDWCIRTDNNRTYFLIDDDASVLANWRYVETPSAAVTSVNGQVGVVVLAYSDVGAQQANAVLTTLTGATADGQALVTASNYAAMRSLLGLGDAALVTLGTGVAAALALAVGSAGAFVVNGGALGTPSSGLLTNATGLPTSGLLNNAVTFAKFQQLAARTMVTNNTGSTADASTSTFDDPGVQTFAETITWSAGAAPSGTTNHTLNWTQVGNLVSYQVFLRFSVSGTTITGLSFPVPSGMPAPLVPSGVTGGNAMLYPNTVRYSNGTTGLFLNNSTGGIRRNSGDSATEFKQANLTSGTYNTFVIFGQYWAA